jgi:hypothetical protein
LAPPKNYRTIIIVYPKKIKFLRQQGRFSLSQKYFVDAVEEHEKEGFTREEAIDMAIKQMGDPLEVGRELNKVHKSKPEWSILALRSYCHSLFIFL